ncbi:potassium voltage-gated channel subfamily A member 2-like [Hydractinia symbiolongicarpus]|uniref:potassium voltage-gated channel subfamily A member 2-like n=1 Tax=Hydractinia symbiolongicarpus TaxID=13093 RepID=UPI00254F1EC6|nr:potassium voltage-gated channel subfamily A member 2-like [Hydractinia symbiolongicarpus]
MSRISLNVSGSLFETQEETLRKYPETLLGDKQKRSKFFCPNTKQFFFDRNIPSFQAILFFYQSSGKLYCPPDINLKIFVEECNFYEIPNANIVAMKKRKGAILNETIQAKLRPHVTQDTSLRMKIWEFLEFPSSSIFARCFALISLLLVFLSVFTNLMETSDGYYQSKQWLYAEFFLNFWFLSELTLRMILAPKKKKFLRNAMNWVDIIVIIPYFIGFLIFETNFYSPRILRLVRIMRVLRMFRTSKHSPQMKAIGLIVKDSLKDLQLFFVCLLIIVTFGASVMYHVEQSDGTTQFTSIPRSMWWAVQTFLTLGYGDIVPTTIIGKALSSIYMVLGVSTISLPVLSLIMKLTSYYELQRR